MKVAKDLLPNHCINLTGMFVLLFMIYSCDRAGDKEFTVMRGSFIQSVTETGELEAGSATVISMPRLGYKYGYNFKLIGLAEHGSAVQAGDSVGALDPSSVYRYILNREESLENLRGKADKQRVTVENAIRELEVQLKNQTAAWELKKLELERMQFEPDMKKKVKQLEFRQAEIRLAKIKRNLELKPLIEKYDLEINRLDILQHQADIEAAYHVLDELTLYSPGNGYFQLVNNRRTRQIYRLGDDVYLGAMIAVIPDVSKMKAESYIAETDISKVRPGMKVIIRMDALPNVEFEGVLRSVSKVCTTREKAKIFTTEIEINGSDGRLKPGMSVSCEYITHETDDALFVPNRCLLKEDNHYYVFVKKATGIQKTEVVAGPSNVNHTIINGDLKAGRELVPVSKMQNL